MSGFLFQVAPASEGVQSVTGPIVNNDDPLNPVVQLPYTSYVVKWYQTSTNAPTVEVLYNNIGGTPVWSRIGVGNYLATLNGIFTENTFIGAVRINWGFADAGDTTYFCDCLRVDDNTLQMEVTKLNEVFEFSQVDGLSDSGDLFIYLEVRIYS